MSFYPTAVSLYDRSIRVDFDVAYGHAVTVSGQCPKKGHKILGISKYSIGQGKMTTVSVMGSVVAIAGSEIAQDDDLTVDDLGRVIPVSSADQRVIGRAMTAADAENSPLEVMLTP